MSYSCTDFIDDLLCDLALRKIIDGDKIPDNDPQKQADLCFAGIGRIMAQRSALIAAARTVIDNWESGDLAGAVRNLASALDDTRATP